LQCEYVDEKTGKQCANTWACSTVGDSKYGYCYSHALKTGRVPKEEADRVQEKRIGKVREAAKSKDWGRIMALKKAKMDARTPAEKKRADAEAKIKENSEKEKVQKLIHQIFGDQDFDAEEMIKEMRTNGADFDYSDKSRKFIFITWSVSDPLTRQPVTLRALCTLLGIKQSTGYEWVNSDWFASEMYLTLNKTMKLAMPVLARMNLTEALQGDFKARQELIKQFGKHDVAPGEEDWEETLGKDVIDEAQRLDGIN